MVRALVEALEASLGPTLDAPGRWLWLGGSAAVALVLLGPLVRAWLDGRVARAGLTWGWSTRCPRCGGTTAPRTACDACGANLSLPWGVGLYARLSAPGAPSRNAALRWLPALLGAGAFGLGTVLFATSAHLFAPAGRLERAFAGLTLVTWASLGLLVGRVSSLRGFRLLERLRALVVATSVALALVAFTSLTVVSRPVTTTAVVILEAQADAVLVLGQRLETTNDEVSVEAQLLEVPAAGLTQLTPLAVVGRQRVLLAHGLVEDWLLETLWTHAASLKTHGVSIRRRSEQFRITPGARYRVEATERELRLEPLDVR